MRRFAWRSTSAKRSGSSNWKRSAASVSTPPMRDTVVTMYAPSSNAAPALAATSRSPVASITTSPRIACDPSLVSTITPDARPSSSTIADWNQLCRRSSTPASATISRAACLKPSGSKAAAKMTGCGLVWVWKSKTPHRDHLRHISSVARTLGSRSASGGYTQSPRRCMRSIISIARPRTEISVSLCMSSSTRTIPPEASPPR